MWWAFVPVLLWLVWHWLTTRDWRAAVVWVAMVAGWLVWFPDLKRTMFLFYMTPLIPFLILGVTLALGMIIGPAVVGMKQRLADLHDADEWTAAQQEVWQSDRRAPHRYRDREPVPRAGHRRLRLDVAAVHRRPAHLRRLARAYVVLVVGMTRAR